jgi:hypothetical protein
LSFHVGVTVGDLKIEELELEVLGTDSTALLLTLIETDGF